jgi:RNA polymerase sigma-70 factor (ECF subfamily)
MASGVAADPLDPARLRDLVARCALRAQVAFADLYRASSAKLFAVAARILRRDDLAEEALQDSFVNIWNHCVDYRADLAAPMTWMTSIVRNRALDLKRRPAIEVTGEDSDAWVEAFEDDAPGPLERLSEAGAARRLQDCLSVIEAGQRQAIALAFMHGMTHAELSGHLRMPLGTVKTSIRRGMSKLKDCLGGSAGAGRA